MGSKVRFMLTAATAALLLLAFQEEGNSFTQAKTPARTHQRRRGDVLRVQPKHGHLKNMVFYMHDLPSGPKPTAVLVATSLKAPGAIKLGATFVFDDKITAGPDPNSTEIGRGQGLYTLASLTSADLLLVFTAVFHKPAIYNGSTICLHGSDRIFMPEREIGIISGTGVFRFARGFATISTVSLDGGLNAILKFNLTMLL